jgi:hypothetical protein
LRNAPDPDERTGVVLVVSATFHRGTELAAERGYGMTRSLQASCGQAWSGMKPIFV